MHLAVFGSTGLGKGVGLMLPILLSYLGSCVVTDPRAENFLKSAAFTEKNSGMRSFDWTRSICAVTAGMP